MGEEIFLEMYRDVDVVVDQPACTLWHIILRQFPEAKAIELETMVHMKVHNHRPTSAFTFKTLRHYAKQTVSRCEIIRRHHNCHNPFDSVSQFNFTLT